VRRTDRLAGLVCAALIGLAGLLAGCAQEPPPPPKQAVALPPPPAPPPRPRKIVRRPAHKPQPPPEETPAGPEEALAMAAPVAPPAPPPAPGPRDLVGLDQPAAKRMLGAAAEQFEQPPATIWRYKAAACQLDLYFYLDLKSGRMRTLHYTMKGDAGGDADRQNCLKSLVAARGT
jgi:hypothetical protein